MTILQGAFSERSRAHLVSAEEGLDVIDQCHNAFIGCDVAHRQGVFLRGSPKRSRMCDTAHMAEFDMDAFRDRLQTLMDAKGIKRKPLAKAAGLGETSIRDLFDDRRHDVRVGTLIKLAGFFEVPVDVLLNEPELRIGGRVGAGGEVIFEGEPDDDQTVPNPPGAHPRILPLEVVGASMLPKYEDGDIVYVDRSIDGIPRGAVGEHCAVRTADGGTYLKILAKGSEPGRYTLRSLNAPDMEDVEVVWAAPVKWVMPRSARVRQ